MRDKHWLKCSTDCGVELTGHLKMLLMDAGLTNEAFYRAADGHYVMVAVSPAVTKCIIAESPEACIEMAERLIYGGL